MSKKHPAAHISLLVAITAGLLVAAFLPGHAAAATPCWKRVLNDWSNGRAIGAYPLHCYRDAIRHLPEDLRDYSSASDDIQAALQAQIAQRNIRTPQINPSSSSGSPSNGSSGKGSKAHKKAERSVERGTARPSRSAYRRAVDNLGTSNADTLPVPLIVLGSLGALLLALAAAMAATKRIRAARADRRGPPPSA